MAKKNRSGLRRQKNCKRKLRTESLRGDRLPFEQLEHRNLLAADFGDAPFPYPVTLAENGAQHAVGTLRLGSESVDMEGDGTHSAQADFDDLNGAADDENGVTFGMIQVGALDQTVTVNVQGASGKLDAWIDFNGDGSWGGLGEQIFASHDVVVGDNHLTIDVPSHAVAGQTFARFRLSSAGNMGVKGGAVDGEVEDHTVTISPVAFATGVFGDQIELATGFDGAVSITTGDLDQDGDMDVVGASAEDGKIRWFENDGNENFTIHVIDEQSTNAADAIIADVDGDGDLDLFTAKFEIDLIEWYENDGNQNFTAHTIATDSVEPIRLIPADVNGDGSLDLISISLLDDEGPYEDSLGKISWHENDGQQNFTSHVISTEVSQPWDVSTVDMDQDGDLDVVSAGFDVSNPDAGEWTTQVVWLENDGNQGFIRRVIMEEPFTSGGIYSVFATDMDGDGDIDVISALQETPGELIWYENDGNENFSAHVISTTAYGSRSVIAADVDGDGDVDVLAASLVNFFSEGDGLAIYENDGSQNFSINTISTEIFEDIHFADLDSDGDLDVLSASRDAGKFTWFAQNQDPVFTSPESAEVIENDPKVQLLAATDGDPLDETFTFMIDGSEADNDLFEIVDGDLLQFKVEPDFENPSDNGNDNTYEVSVLADDGNGGVTPQTIFVSVANVPASVSERSLFFNDSSFDADEMDDVDAIALDKTPLLDGEIATFQNYSSFSKGINGIIVSVVDLNETPTLETVSEFFEFKIGNNNLPETWAAAPLPIGLNFLEDTDGNGRSKIVLAWADNAIKKTWLQVNVLANTTTGLSEIDTFYFGNAPGETGNDPANAVVNLADLSLTRDNQTGFGSADIENAYDFDRDGIVNLIDVAIVRSNQSGFSPLQLIDLSETAGKRLGGGKAQGLSGKGSPIAGKPEFSALSSLLSNPIFNDEIEDNSIAEHSIIRIMFEGRGDRVELKLTGENSELNELPENELDASMEFEPNRNEFENSDRFAESLAAFDLF